MRRSSLGIGCAAVVVAAAALLPASIAGADSVTAPATGGSWYWSSQNEGSVTTPAGPFAVNPFPSPVSKTGNLSVGQSNGSSERETYLHVDATSIPAGSTVSTLVITLHEDLKDSGGGSNQSLAKIKAVPVKEFWGDGVYAAPYSQRPARDDSFSGVEGKRAVDAATQVVTWTFDMAPIANLWTAGTQNNGVAFVPEPGTPAPAAGAPNPSDSWNVVWAGVNNDDQALRPKVVGQFTPGSGTSSSSGLTTSSSNGLTASAPSTESSASLTSSALPSGPSLAAPTPPVRTPPAVRPSGTPTRGRLITAHPKRAAPATFYLAGVAVLGLMAIAGLTLGELGEPALERRGSVLRALERRGEEGT